MRALLIFLFSPSFIVLIIILITMRCLYIIFPYGAR